MAQFDPKKVLRQVSNDLLRQLFEHYECPIELAWAELSETDVLPIFNAWQQLEEGSRRNIEIVLHEIGEMAIEDGIRAIVEEARRLGEDDLIENIELFESRHDKTVWTLIHSPDIWQLAVRFARADSLSRGRYWIRRIGLPAKQPETTEIRMQELEQAFSAFFQLTQARGRLCRIEHLLRASGVDYFFAYLDDYADTYINFNESGGFARTPERRAFELVLAYDSESGILDMFVKGGKKVYVPLQEIFGRVILREEIGPEDRNSHPYELNGLVHRDFPFPTDIDDGIVGVRVKRLRLTVQGMPRRRITLEADPEGNRDDIYDMMDSLLARERLPAALLNVTQVGLKFEFDPHDETLPKSLSLDVSYPNSSNLKSKPERLKVLGEKYLRAWGLDRAGVAQHHQSVA